MALPEIHRGREKADKAQFLREVYDVTFSGGEARQNLWKKDFSSVHRGCGLLRISTCVGASLSCSFCTGLTCYFAPSQEDSLLGPVAEDGPEDSLPDSPEESPTAREGQSELGEQNPITEDSPPDSPGARSPTTVREGQSEPGEQHPVTEASPPDSLGEGSPTTVREGQSEPGEQNPITEDSPPDSPGARSPTTVREGQSEPGEQHPVTEASPPDSLGEGSPTTVREGQSEPGEQNLITEDSPPDSPGARSPTTVREGQSEPGEQHPVTEASPPDSLGERSPTTVREGQSEPGEQNPAAEDSPPDPDSPITAKEARSVAGDGDSVTEALDAIGLAKQVEEAENTVASALAEHLEAIPQERPTTVTTVLTEGQSAASYTEGDLADEQEYACAQAVAGKLIRMLSSQAQVKLAAEQS